MGRIAEEREKVQVRLDKIERIFYINSGAQTLAVWAFSDFVENLRTTISKKLIIIL